METERAFAQYAAFVKELKEGPGRASGTYDVDPILEPCEYVEGNLVVKEFVRLCPVCKEHEDFLIGRAETKYRLNTRKWQDVKNRA